MHSTSSNLRINSRIIIPSSELQWRFSRSSGPGGQNVNTTDSRVELLFNIQASSSLGDFRKKQLLEKLSKKLARGWLRVVAAEERSQYLNKKSALVRMRNIIIEGLKSPPKPRAITKPTKASERRRIHKKKHRGEVKRNRTVNYSIDN